jgi:hypothetical protein
LLPRITLVSKQPKSTNGAIGAFRFIQSTGAYPDSCYAALNKTACGPFRKEGPMKFDNATKFHRKSGVA